MSFIDLMADLHWSDTDIVNRTEAMIASKFPDIAILQRKVQGQMLGQYTLTPVEQAELQAYAAASFTAGALANEARADMALLRQVFAVESAQRKLDALSPIPAEGDDPDAEARSAAQAVIDGASEDVMRLVEQRAALRTPLTSAPVDVNEVQTA